MVYSYNLLKDIEAFAITSELWSFLKNPSPYRAHYKCSREEVLIFDEKINGNHYTFYRNKDILANFVLTENGGVYLISCTQEDIWDALKECKPVKKDVMNR